MASSSLLSKINITLLLAGNAPLFVLISHDFLQREECYCNRLNYAEYLSFLSSWQSKTHVSSSAKRPATRTASNIFAMFKQTQLQEFKEVGLLTEFRIIFQFSLFFDILWFLSFSLTHAFLYWFCSWIQSTTQTTGIQFHRLQQGWHHW